MYAVTTSTREVLVNTSTLGIGSTFIVHLSSLSSSSPVMIRDANGFCSTNRKIIVSTTNGVFFQSLLSSYILQAPFAYLSVKPTSPTQWITLQSYTLPPAQTSLSIADFTTSSIQTSSIQITSTPVYQNITANSLVVNSFSSIAFSASRNLFVSSSATFASTCTTPLSSVNSIFANSISTQGSFATNSNLFVNGSSILNIVDTNSNCFISSLFLTAPFSALNSSFLSTVSANIFFAFNSSRFLSNVAFQDTAIFSSFQVNVNISTLSRAEVAARTTTSSLLVQHNATMANVSATTILTPFLSSISSLTLTDSLSVKESTITSTLYMNDSARMNSLRTTTVSMIGNTPSYTSEFPTVNASQVYQNGSNFSYGDTLNTVQTTFLSTNLLQINANSIRWNPIQATWTLFSRPTTSVALNSQTAMSYSGNYLYTVNVRTLNLSADFGSNWTTTALSGVTGSYVALSTSETGQYVITGGNQTRINVSNNFGASFTTLGSTPLSNYNSAAVSATGQYMSIALSNGNIYVSNNFGASFTARANTNPWTSIAMSSNGQWQVASYASGYVVISSNFGTTWSTNIFGGPIMDSLLRNRVAVSYSGQYVMAATSSNLFVSSDYGSNFTQTFSSSANIFGIAISGTGQYQTLCLLSGSPKVWYSDSFGSNWTPLTGQTSSPTYNSINISLNSDFQVLYVVTSSNFYISRAPLQFFYPSITFNSDLSVSGTLSKGAGSFEIQHPLNPEKRLVHSFIEGPRCDLLYRGKVILSNGRATVDLEKESTANGSQMTPGTFKSIARNAQVFLRNNQTNDRVRGFVQGNQLVILSKTPSSATIDWIVVAERADPCIRQWDCTDSNGLLIPERA